MHQTHDRTRSRRQRRRHGHSGLPRKTRQNDRRRNGGSQPGPPRRRRHGRPRRGRGGTSRMRRHPRRGGRRRHQKGRRRPHAALAGGQGKLRRGGLGAGEGRSRSRHALRRRGGRTAQFAHGQHHRRKRGVRPALDPTRGRYLPQGRSLRHHPPSGGAPRHGRSRPGPPRIARREYRRRPLLDRRPLRRGSHAPPRRLLRRTRRHPLPPPRPSRPPRQSERQRQRQGRDQLPHGGRGTGTFGMRRCAFENNGNRRRCAECGWAHGLDVCLQREESGGDAVGEVQSVRGGCQVGKGGEQFG
mmetsp:Transcript_11488/g.23553  ORF Transcript_11488/g.23553 Transcript_11488/m.23553 type:complete len:300 (-) Transcript_11488:747-1646(-)